MLTIAIHEVLIKHQYCTVISIGTIDKGKQTCKQTDKPEPEPAHQTYQIMPLFLITLMPFGIRYSKIRARLSRVVLVASNTFSNTTQFKPKISHTKS